MKDNTVGKPANGRAVMAKRLLAEKMRHIKTSKGFTGFGGGRWGKMPQPPQWYSSSTQLCGIYPFSAGTSRPNTGTPLGRDMNVDTAVCGDMKTWYDAGLISSSSMMLFGLNGNGKSSVAQRFIYSMAARGIVPMVFDPLKDEYGEMVEALGGRVLRVGPRGRDKINLLHLGALGEAAAKIGGTTGEDMRRQAVSQAVDMVALVVQINRGSPLSDSEDAVLALMVRSVISRVRRPSMHDLVDAFLAPPPEVLSAVACNDAAQFLGEYRALHLSVLALLSGEMGALIGGSEAMSIPVGNPGGFCFDTSSIPASNTKLLSAAMLATWNIGFSAIDAHWELSRHDPSVHWGGYLAVQDEFWYPMRACEGIIDRADRIGRTNRGLGVSELKITHSPKDFLSLPNAKDRETAKGFAQRCGVLGLMALSLDDLHALSAVQPLNGKEIATVAGFNTPPDWKPNMNADGTPAPPPGAGKILLKIPGRVGLPVQMTLTAIEKAKHITDERSNRVAFAHEMETV
ncbi:ATP-binding protein [Pseudarthrobacter oxydans]|uniref:ATP-binding protein n=1 Tax=Pseudarthrobacter oxydans TaxID=1671 RepID=UPI003427BCD9